MYRLVNASKLLKLSRLKIRNIREVSVSNRLCEDDDDVIVPRYSRVSDAEAGAASLSSIFAVFFFLFLFLLLLCASLSVGGTCGERK